MLPHHIEPINATISIIPFITRFLIPAMHLLQANIYSIIREISIRAILLSRTPNDDLIVVIIQLRSYIVKYHEKEIYYGYTHIPL